MSDERIETDVEITALWRDYERARAYQDQLGISRKFPEFVAFYEGKQWPAPTKNTLDMPRPVVNIIKMICRNKISAILSSSVKIVYRAEASDADTEKFNDFADYIQKEMGQEKLDKDAVNDGVKKGPYVYHYYWDAEARGKAGSMPGALRCEIIDPLNIYFADPTEVDEQKQKWIMIASREPVSSVRAKCDEGVDLDLIVPDENDSKYNVIEQEESRLCTVLTRYFRQSGQVMCEIATRSATVRAPFSLCPDVSEEDADGCEDAPNNSLPDKGEDGASLRKGGVKGDLDSQDGGECDADRSASGEGSFADGDVFSLYPVVVGNYERREHSIYGIGEVEGLIPNQKAINLILAMMILDCMQTAWGKYTVLPNALRGQVITNEPGQVLTDHSGTGNGIKKLGGAGMNTTPIQLIDTISELTRVVTGSTEVMTGETLGASMSGAAIAQLQSQAQQPMEELRDAFWLVKEKQGKVMAQFFKHYYTEAEFTYSRSASEIAPEMATGMENVPNGMIPAELLDENKEVKLSGVFNSSEYKNTEFSVVVETMSGTRASAAGDINILDMLLGKGLISLRTYIKAYPKDAISNRTEILKGIEEDEAVPIKELQSQLESALAQIEQLTAENTQMEAVIKEQSETVSDVIAIIQENNSLKMQLAALYTEAADKVRALNEQVQLGNARISEAESDAKEFAEHIFSNEYGADVPVGAMR